MRPGDRAKLTRYLMDLRQMPPNSVLPPGLALSQAILDHEYPTKQEEYEAISERIKKDALWQ